MFWITLHRFMYQWNLFSWFFLLPRVFLSIWLFTYNDFFKYARILTLAFLETIFFSTIRIEDEYIRVMIMIWNLHTIYCWLLFVFIVIFKNRREKRNQNIKFILNVCNEYHVRWLLDLGMISQFLVNLTI